MLLGEGIAWLFDFLGADAVAGGALVPVLRQWRPKERGAFYFVYVGRKYGVPKVAAFIGTALELVAGPNPTSRIRGVARG